MKSQGLKRAIALKIAHDTGLRFVDTLAVVNRFMDEVLQLLSAGKEVALHSFGTFSVRTRKEQRLALMTGGHMTVPAQRFVKFKMGNMLKAGVTDGKKVTLLGRTRCRKSEKQPS